MTRSRCWECSAGPSHDVAIVTQVERDQQDHQLNLALSPDDRNADSLDRRSRVKEQPGSIPQTKLDRAWWKGRRDGVVHLEGDAGSGRQRVVDGGAVQQELLRSGWFEGAAVDEEVFLSGRAGRGTG